jgi:hypothetical protein
MMPRYFFNMIEGHSTTLMRDCEGVVLSSVSAARKEAVGLARDVARHGFHRSIQTWRVVVSSENGDEILTVPLSEIHVLKPPAWLYRYRPAAGYSSWRVFALLAVTALLAMIVYAAMTTTRVVEQGGGYEVASAPVQNGLVDVRFVPGASAAEITNFLESYQATLVDGPRMGGFYRVRIVDTALQHDAIGKIAGKMAKEHIVELAAVVQ